MNKTRTHQGPEDFDPCSERVSEGSQSQEALAIQHVVQSIKLFHIKRRHQRAVGTKNAILCLALLI